MFSLITGYKAKIETVASQPGQATKDDFLIFYR